MAKAHPGKLNFAISGIGGAPQLAGIEFAQRTGVNWTYIPYKGGSDAVTAVVGGQAHVLFNGMLATWPSVHGRAAAGARHLERAARARGAGHAHGRRAGPARLRDRLLPGRGRAGRRAARHDVCRLNAELTRILNTAEMKERFAKQGTEVRTGTPESLGTWLRTEQANWAKVVKESGAKFD